jgi:hypothetical protein
MSKFIEVFKFKGSAMRTKGNFFALMFFVLGLGAFVVLFYYRMDIKYCCTGKSPLLMGVSWLD